MNKVLAILLLVCLSCQYIGPLGIVGWYEANKDYVARVLCENKDKPQMKCCGKCFVRKQLAKTVDSPGEKDTSVKQVKTGSVFIVPEPFCLAISIPKVTPKQISVYTLSVYKLLTKDIFHPPAFY